MSSKRASRHLLVSPVPSVGADTGAALTTEQAVFLDIFGQAPVGFHRVFVDITGSVVSALWLSHTVCLISQILQSSSAPGNAQTPSDIWFSMSMEECTTVTGLSRREQESARESLRDMGMLFERRSGFGSNKQYRLEFSVLANRLRKQSSAAWGLGDGRAPSATATSNTSTSTSQLNSAAL
jgi:hypothetical protein